ncbi:MAG: aquaporin [Planctomycetes bacterium]|nr:aquaporin [Planctomycetota bacterium]
MDKNFRPYLAELVGTFVVVFLGAGAVCMNTLAAVPWPADQPSTLPVIQPEPGLLGIALVRGLALAVALAATVHISGGYLNPAVTLMLWVYKRLDGFRTSMLIFVQLLGAALAGGLLRLVFAFRIDSLASAHLGTPHLNLRAFGAAGLTGKALFSGIGLEIILTFILTFVIFATMIDPRAPRLLGRLGHWLSSLWVGLILAAITFVGTNFTGAAVNPARWFGTVIWEKTVPALQLQQPFSDQMVFWIGPVLGALLAGGVYTTLILPSEEEHRPGHASPPPAGNKVSAGAGSTLFRSKK